MKKLRSLEQTFMIEEVSSLTNFNIEGFRIWLDDKKGLILLDKNMHSDSPYMGLFKTEREAISFLVIKYGYLKEI